MVPFRGPPGQRATTESQLPIKKGLPFLCFSSAAADGPILPQGYGKYKGGGEERIRGLFKSRKIVYNYRENPGTGVPEWREKERDSVMAKRNYIPITADVPGVSESQRAFIRKVIRTALAAEGVDFPCEVDVSVTSDAGIQALNRDMRGVDRPTDVLSFPAFDLIPGELPGPEDADPATGLVPLGDMCLSLERVKAQAREYGHSNRRELA